MNKLKVLGVAVVFGALSTTLQASGFSYNYLDVGFGITDNVDNDSTGEFKTMSGAFQTQSGPFVAFESTGYEEDGQYNVDLTALGVGAFTATGGSTDFYGTLQLVNADFGTGSDQSGYRVSMGFRSAFGSHVELDAKVKFEEVYDESDTSVYLAARFYATPTLAAAINYDSAGVNGSDIDSYYASIRLAF